MNKHSLLTDIKIQEFINKLEQGIDGTIFAPYDKYGDKAYKSTHFGLSILLTFAFDLLNNETEQKYLEISFNDFYNYVENAKTILTDMRYIEGDRLIPNDYNLKIYENPKNYSVVDLKQILPITPKQLKVNYLVPDIFTSENGFFTYKEQKKYKLNRDKLTPREYEAFYGETAQKCLGILPKSKRKEKNLKI